MNEPTLVTVATATHPVIRRPQRTLTDKEWKTVGDTSLLNIHGALIMGIVDPVPNASPMSEDEGAWVREQVWPKHYTDIERKYPFGFARWSKCERGTCWNCLASRCDRCVHRQQGGPDIDDNTAWVYNTRGRSVARLILRADNAPCVWWCRCACAKTGPLAAAPFVPETPAPGDQADTGTAARRGRRPRALGAGDSAQDALF